MSFTQNTTSVYCAKIDEMDSEHENVQVPKNKARHRLVLYCVISYVFLMIIVPLCFYLRDRLDLLPCDYHMSVPLLNHTFHENGTVEMDNKLYLTDQMFSVNGTTRVCKCQLKPCIRKCCAKDEHLVTIPKVPSWCSKNPAHSPFDNFSVPVYLNPDRLADIEKNHFDILYGNVCTNGKLALNPKKYPKDKHFLMVNGNLYHKEKYLDSSKYCLDSRNGSDIIYTYKCFDKKDKEAELVFSMYPIFLLFSCVFLVVTFIIYSMIPELRNVHGKCLMSYVISLFVTNISVSVTLLTGKAIPKLPCIMLGKIIQIYLVALGKSIFYTETWSEYSSLVQEGG